MKQIAFVSCSKLKTATRAPAAALYTSALFRKSLLAALTHADQTFILSAKHGVVSLGDRLAPYDVTLKTMKLGQRRVWANKVGRQLKGILQNRDVAALYCGQEYSMPLSPTFSELGARVREPLGRLSLGRRLRFLAEQNEEAKLADAHKGFTKLMRRLWVGQKGGRRFSDSSGKDRWPKRGVYFIFEAPDAQAPHRMPRLVRIGTHAVSSGSQTSLWNRLSTHRGVSSGGGSHRSSIFRLHVGRALMQRDRNQNWPTTWGIGQSAAKDIRDGEEALERRVSETIGEFRILWLDVADTPGPSSDRSYIERNSIGILSRTNLLSPKAVGPWLGTQSPDWRIAVSGLWNLDHLFSNPDAAFLTILERYVELTLRGDESPSEPIAPERRMDRRVARRAAQLQLFSEDGGIDAECSADSAK